MGWTIADDKLLCNGEVQATLLHVWELRKSDTENIWMILQRGYDPDFLFLPAVQGLNSDARRKQAHEAIQQALGGPILIPLVVNGHPCDLAQEWPQYKEEVHAELLRGGEGALVARLGL